MPTYCSDSGGYDYEFVGTIASKYICGICMKVLRDAQLMVCCGQHYCQTCLKEWLSSDIQGRIKTCPHCRKESFQSVPNKEKTHEINEFKMHCIHRGKGCGWMGELGALKDHLDSDKGCGYVQVKCTHSACEYKRCPPKKMITCGAAIERRQLANHQKKECVYRQCTCQYCGYVDTYDAIARSGQIRNEGTKLAGSGNHYDECGNYPLKCPNECEDRGINRKDMKTHRDTCPLEPLDCPFQYVGCTAGKTLRRDMYSHCQESMQHHLLLVVQSLQLKSEELERKNEELVCKNEELAGKIKELEYKGEDLREGGREQEGICTPDACVYMCIRGSYRIWGGGSLQ